MILEVLACDLEQRAALLHPFRGPASVEGHQATDVPNPLALGYNSGLRQDSAVQRGNDCTSSQSSVLVLKLRPSIRAEQQTQSQLIIPRRILLAADDAKDTRVDARIRHAELDPVECVEGLHAELHAQSFIDARVLDHEHIEIGDPRTPQVRH